MANGENEIERRVDMVQLGAEIKACVVSIEANTEKTDKLLKVMYDNGLATQVALNKQSLGRLWKWTGSISAAFLGLAAWVLRGTFK